MDSALAAAAASVTFEDGLGIRRRGADRVRNEALEWLCLRAELTSAPSFEAALRERVKHLAGFRHGCYGQVRSVERLNEGSSSLALVSDATDGVRLSEVLEFAERADVTLDIDAALCLLRQIVPAVAMLHEEAPDVANGAIAAERLVVTAGARVVVVEHVLGSALEALRFSHERYWKELRIALPKAPKTAGLPRIGHRADVTQVGVVALSLILGRRLLDDEGPSHLGDLVASAWAVSARGGLEPLPPGLRAWLMCALQLDAKNSFASAIAAQHELERLLGENDYLAAPATLESFLAAYQATVAPITKVTPVAAAARIAPVPQPEPFTHTAPGPAVVVPAAGVASSAANAHPAPVAHGGPAPTGAPMPHPAPVAGATPLARSAVTAVVEPVAPLLPLAPAASPAAAAPATLFATIAPLASAAPLVAAASPAPARDVAAAPATTRPRTPPAVPPLQEDPVAWPVPLDTRPIRLGESSDEDEDENEQPRRSRWQLVAAALVLIALAGAGVAAARRYAAPAQASQDGTLSVTTNPSGARLFVDGVERGTTPFSLTLKAGPHALELLGGGVPRQLPITITAGAQMSQYIELPAAAPAVGQLMVRTEPAGAGVSVDGVARGTSPVTVNDLAVGEHAVLLESSLGSVKQTVVIEAGITASLVVPLVAPETAPVPGWIAVSAPSEVQIFEGTRLIGTSQSDRLMIPPGRHEIQIVNETLGYRATRTLQVSPGKVSPVRIEFPTGTIAINAIPWADVWVDGASVGDTPIGNLQLTVGPHEFLFRHPDLGEQRHAATVTLMAPARLSVDLRKK